MGYLNQAATELTAAMEREKEGEFSSAIRGYRTAVDILITGVQGKKIEEDGLVGRGGEEEKEGCGNIFSSAILQ